MGTLSNYTNIDSATGNLSFAGTSQYLVGGNKYAFVFSGNPNYGLYFNQTNLRYEFRDGTAAPVVHIGANDGSGYFKGNLGANDNSCCKTRCKRHRISARREQQYFNGNPEKWRVEMFVGRNSLGALPPGLTQGDIALNYGGRKAASGILLYQGIMHWPTLTPMLLTFYINNSTFGLSSSQTRNR